MKQVPRNIQRSYELLPDRWRPAQIPSEGNSRRTVNNRQTGYSCDWIKHIRDPPLLYEPSYKIANCRLPKLSPEPTNSSTPRRSKEAQPPKGRPGFGKIIPSMEPILLPQIVTPIPTSIALKPRETLYKRVVIPTKRPPVALITISKRPLRERKQIKITHLVASTPASGTSPVHSKNNKVTQVASPKLESTNPSAEIKPSTDVPPVTKKESPTKTADKIEKKVIDSKDTLSKPSQQNKEDIELAGQVQRRHQPHRHQKSVTLGPANSAKQETQRLEKLHREYYNALPNLHYSESDKKKIEQAAASGTTVHRLLKGDQRSNLNSTLITPSSDVISEFIDPDIRPCDLRNANESFAYSDVREYIEDNDLMLFSKWRRIFQWSQLVCESQSSFPYDRKERWYEFPESETCSLPEKLHDSSGCSSSTTIDCLP